MKKYPYLQDVLIKAERHLDDCLFDERGSRAIERATETIQSIKAAIAVGEEYEPDF